MGFGASYVRNRFSRKNKRPAWKMAAAFGEWLRKRPCACQGHNPDCGGVMMAAHVDYAAKGTPDAKGMSSKVADRWQIPLTDNCHRLQHSKGWPWFEANILKCKAEDLADFLWRKWPGRIEWEAQQQ